MKKLTVQEIFETVATILQISTDLVTIDLSPSNCSPWDSLAQISIISELIVKHKIEFGFDDFEKIKDMRSLLSVIKNIEGERFEY